MVVKYFANDGKSFTNKKDCVDYEEELIKKEEERKKLKDEKEERLKEINDAYDHYLKLVKAYKKDYEFDVLSLFNIF